uniref:pre-toxin TG domain-containing protein n=1 Tax=Vibrio ostreicida TaxID=526588 RepID=UPI0009712EBB
TDFTLIEALELTMDFVPVVSNLKAAYEFSTGETIFGGIELEALDRNLAGASIFLGPVAKAAIKTTKVAVTVARHSDEAADLLTASSKVHDATKATDAALDVTKSLGVVQSRINIANGRTRFTPLRESGYHVSAGFQHVLDGHFGRSLANNRSIFSIEPSDLKSILQSKSVVQSPVTDIGGGQFSRVVDVGKTIGNTSLNDGGGATSRLRILSDRAGNLITTYPVK